jgi:hypothetical protein
MINFKYKYIKYLNKNIYMKGCGIENNEIYKIMIQHEIELSDDLYNKIIDLKDKFHEEIQELDDIPLESRSKIERSKIKKSDILYIILLSNSDSLCVKTGNIISFIEYKTNVNFNNMNDIINVNVNVNLVYTTKECRGKKEEKSYIFYMFDILKKNLKIIDPYNTTETLRLVIVPMIMNYDYEQKLIKIYTHLGFQLDTITPNTPDYPYFMIYTNNL